MRTKMTAFIILSITAFTVMAVPYIQTSTNSDLNGFDPFNNVQHSIERPKIEVVFVLDTTSSMSGLIEAAKEKIWSITNSMASSQNSPEVKMGLVAFRDRGDSYVTRTLDLSSDLDSIYATLMDFKAQGGGDGPESVNQAIYDAVHKISWSQNKNTYKVVFLVGDAPAHMDYQDDIKYPETLAVAIKKGIKINTIQSGQSSATMANWKQIASLGQGAYFQVGQSGDAIAISTPYDEQLATLSSELDDTKMYFGDAEEKVKQQSKVAASRKLHKVSSKQALARRAAFNTSSSGKDNFLGEGELVDAITSGKVGLADIDKDNLPKSIQAMAPAAQMEVIEEKNERRNKLRQDILELTGKRAEFLKEEVAKAGKKDGSLDDKIYQTVREQAKEKGLIYASDSASY